jgi:TPR repeat protein
MTWNIHVPFIATLKPPFKFSPHDPRRRPLVDERCAISGQGGACHGEGEVAVARFEIAEIERATLGEASANADVFYDLGMMYSIGRSVPIDLVSAHKWFNLAAMKGKADAIRLRREIADQLSETQVAAAQRAARDWLTAH